MEAEPTFPVVEIFGPTIAGEGMDAGRRTCFIRFGYCDGLPSGHCTWCDSMHAVDPKLSKTWERLTTEQIVGRLLDVSGSSRTVTLSGGNPLLYDLQSLCLKLIALGFVIWVETQGTIYRDWLTMCSLTVSPKPPSAGTCDRKRLTQFLEMRSGGDFADTAVKVPIDPGFQDGADFEFARSVFDEVVALSFGFEMCLSVVTYPGDTTIDVLNRWEQVVEWAMEELPYDVRILPQLHVLLWGHAKGV